MKVTIWGIALTAGLALALVTLGGHVGTATWSVVTLFFVGACCHRTQPQLAMMLFGIAAIVSIGVVARDHLAIGVLTTVVAVLLVALTGIAWRRQWRQMRRDIVHQAIDQQLVPMDLPCPCDASRTPELVLNAARPLSGNQTADVPEPIEVQRRRA